MWAAWAAEAGAHAAEAEPFYLTAEFWVAIGFFLFVIAIGRTVYRVLTVALDDRAVKIRNRIDEAERLAEQAAETLEKFRHKQAQAADEAKALLDRARAEADRTAKQAAAELEASLKRREQLALDRIAQAEVEAVADIRSRAVDLALTASRRLLGEKLTAAKADALVDDAIAQLAKSLH
jgi:F-type H+-transporting ATPase subunit b